MLLRWSDIRSRYPNEHVLIANPQTTTESPSLIESGDVVDHDPELDTLLDRCDLARYERYALKYTGDLGSAIGQRGMVRVIEHD